MNSFLDGSMYVLHMLQWVIITEKYQKTCHNSQSISNIEIMQKCFLKHNQSYHMKKI